MMALPDTKRNLEETMQPNSLVQATRSAGVAARAGNQEQFKEAARALAQAGVTGGTKADRGQLGTLTPSQTPHQPANENQNEVRRSLGRGR